MSKTYMVAQQQQGQTPQPQGPKKPVAPAEPEKMDDKQKNY